MLHRRTSATCAPVRSFRCPWWAIASGANARLPNWRPNQSGATLHRDTMTALLKLSAAMAGFRDAFDPSNIEKQDLPAALNVLATVEHAAASAAALLAASVSAGLRSVPGPEPHFDDRALVALCARTWGTTPADASKAIATGRRAAAQPEFMEAALSGQLSRHQAQLVGDAAAQDPEVTSYLVRVACTRTLRSLSAECRRITLLPRANDDHSSPDAVLSLDTEPTHSSEDRVQQPDAGIDCPRRLRVWHDRRGVWHLSAQGTAGDGRRIMSAIQRVMTTMSASAEVNGAIGERADLEGHPALAFDALLAMAETALDDLPTYRPVTPGAATFARHPHAMAPVNDLARSGSRLTFSPARDLPLEAVKWLFRPAIGLRSPLTRADRVGQPP